MLAASSWGVVYYAPPNPADSPVAFLDDCPVNVEATMTAVLDAVAAAPPPKFSGGGYWEAMHGKMTGFFEVRKQGKHRYLNLSMPRPRGTAPEAAQPGP